MQVETTKEMTNRKRQILGYIAIIIAVVLWGMSFVWTTQLLQLHFPVFTIIMARLIIASIVLLLIFKTTNQIEHISRKDFGLFACLALCEPFLYFIGENFGLIYVSPSLTAAIIALIPIATAFGLHIFYKENLRKKLIFGAIISTIGIFIMSFSSTGFVIGWQGLLLLLLAVLSATGYGLILQKILAKGYGPVTITTWQNIISIVYYLPCFLIFELDDLPTVVWSSKAVFNLVVLGVLCSAVAFALYSASAKVISVAGATIFTNVIPVVTLIVSVGIGLEALSVQKAIGILVVIGGVLLSQITYQKKDKSKEEGKNKEVSNK